MDSMVRIAEINFVGSQLDSGRILNQALSIATSYCEAGSQRDWKLIVERSGGKQHWKIIQTAWRLKWLGVLPNL